MTLDLTPAEYVLIVRRRMKLTQVELSKLIGVTSKTIDNLENGRVLTKGKTLDRIKLLADRKFNGK